MKSDGFTASLRSVCYLRRGYVVNNLRGSEAPLRFHSLLTLPAHYSAW
nr:MULTISPECIES: gluconate 5-dehydrogenase [Yersinia pseudotuberculosis complex]